ncbi:MAG: hypothetical protein CBC49_002340 [Alphaproteobacteria bacterium TMED89]|nr:MAG: hypothetical protein CBC49_002340 [Alphaproteobacteria bacterium TMED89]
MGRLEDAKTRLDTVLHRLEAIGDRLGPETQEVTRLQRHISAMEDAQHDLRSAAASATEQVAQLMAELQAAETSEE